MPPKATLHMQQCDDIPIGIKQNTNTRIPLRSLPAVNEVATM